MSADAPATIEPCTLATFATILPVLEGYPDLFSYQDRRDIIRYALRTLEENLVDMPLLLARHEGKTLGFAGTRHASDNPHEAILFILAVKRDRVGEGLGSRLLSAVIGALRPYRYDRLTLNLASTAPPRTLKFFRTNHFRQQLDDTYTGESRYTHLLLSRSLTEDAGTSAQPETS